MRKEKQIEITSISTLDWIIPLYGNPHIMPYGTICVRGKVDGMDVCQNCKTHGDKIGDHLPQYVIFQGVRFIVRNDGTMYVPKLRLERWLKEKINNRWMYIA